ncbi:PLASMODESMATA CALLOSE-BINDING PROTEIN 1-like [Bidens hawaiensis]|uniref:PLASMODESMATA CALLOSE-BINDING PROTEIN 1-like n=1 Tax=Bidens hawaiensis TaxID=980011 RepID=UPI004049A8A1
MAALLLSLLIFSMATHSSATWCVCKKDGDDKVLQQAIDYACGNGADCTQTHQGGKCFKPDTVMDHCNYAVNSYFQNKAQAPDSCDFKGAATVVTSDPSSNGCTFPTSACGTGTGNTRSPPNINVNGGLGGVGGGAMGPSASDDVSHGGVRLHKQSSIFGFLAMVVGAGVAMMLT